MEDQLTRNIIIRDSLLGMGKDDLAGYLAHAYCYEGECRLCFNGNKYLFSKGDCMVIRRTDLVTLIEPGEGFCVKVIYVTPDFIEVSTPQSNYGMRGQLSLFQNPVMHLNEDQQKVCALDFDFIERKLALERHNFHRDAMINAIQCMIIDLFDFHACLYGNEKVTTQYAALMEQFLGMLDRGDFRTRRETSYYASELCVTAKYLSEVCKQVSGFPASYWIGRYTALDISRSLRDRSKTLTRIADDYGFSSSAYLTRYVQKYLGQSPTDFRE